MLGNCTGCHVCAHGRLYRPRERGPVRLRESSPWLRSIFAAAVRASGLDEPLLFSTDSLGGSVAMAVSTPRMIVVSEPELRAHLAAIWRRNTTPPTRTHDPDVIFTRQVFDSIAAAAVIAHELGHIAAFDQLDYRTGPDAEADADHFAGRVLARMNLRIVPASLLFDAIGCRTLRCTHPRPWERRSAFHDGHAYELRVRELEVTIPWFAT